MKSTFTFLLVLFACTISFAQDDDSWRDSLIVARKAYANKDYAKALKYYESAQKKAPEDIDLSDEMAQSAYRSRDFERAEKIYRQGSSNETNKRKRGDAMHNLGNSQMRQENYEGAVESYKEALRSNPNDEETRYNLSEAVRKVKEKRTPPPPKPKDPNDGDPNDGDDGNKGQNGDQKDGQGENSKDSKGNQSKGSQGQEDSKKSGQGGGSSDSPEGKLSNQMVERTLDKLAKKEGETKRQMMGAGAGGRSAKSGKDW